MSVEFHIDAFQLENNPHIIVWYQRFAKECLKEAQKLAAERIVGGTGQYQRSFHFELIPGSPPKLVFGNTSPHAIYVEEDTVAHVVRPVRKKALRWFDPPGGGEGAAVFAKEVHIPAHEGMHIVRDAVTAAGDRLNANQGRLL